jgi:outer membrane lipopolysaccharide assembly protein LptE/RlpB
MALSLTRVAPEALLFLSSHIQSWEREYKVSRLITEVLRSYVANEQQFLAAVEEEKKALREGKVVDHATIVAAFERISNPRR